MAGEFFGPYRLLSRLGRGGAGEVHEAFDTARERTVALKRLHAEDQDDPDVRERFRRESRIAARLDSPHVIPIHDFGVIDGRMFIDMRLVRGRDLGDLVKAEGPLAPDRAVAIVEQVADALDAAHEAGLVHRDVKPSNVLLAARDFVYLADFGIVHVGETSEHRLTVTGSALGTPSYMAPEQLRGVPFDQRLDVYALGCVLFEALTGRPPFVGNRMAVMLSHLNDEPPRPSRVADGVPPFLDDVVQRSLAKEPAARPASAGELAAQAQEALGGGETETDARTYRTTSDPVTVDDSRRRTAAGPGSRPSGSGTLGPPTPPRLVRPDSPPRGVVRAPAPRPSPAGRPAPPAPRPVARGPVPAAPVPATPVPAKPASPAASAPGDPAPAAAAAPADLTNHGSGGVVALVLAVLVPPVGAVAGLLARRRAVDAARRRATVAAVVGTVLTVAIAVGIIVTLQRPPAVPAVLVEAQIVAKSGLAPGQVSCPGPLPARVGSTLDCTATSRGRTQTLRTTVTAVEGDQVAFDITAE